MKENKKNELIIQLFTLIENDPELNRIWMAIKKIETKECKICSQRTKQFHGDKRKKLCEDCFYLV